MTLANAGACPGWHDAASEPSWIFVDELVVEIRALSSVARRDFVSWCDFDTKGL